MTAWVFYFFAAVAVLFSLLVVFLPSPVSSTLSLVVSFFGVSGLFVLLSAPFLGVIQILIYAGAILVLFLYVTMLLDVQAGIASAKKHPLARLIPLAGVPLLVSAILLSVPLPDGAQTEVPQTFGSVASIGESLLGPGALLFELASLVLLVGIVGAVMLSLRKKELV